MKAIRDAAESIRAVLHERTEWGLSELYEVLGEVDELTRGLQSPAGKDSAACGGPGRDA